LNIKLAKKLLEQGDVIAIPTETVYGLAGNALNDEAVLKIFKVKNRPNFDPLIIHTNSVEKVKQNVSDFPPMAQQLADAFWPGPLTLLLPKIAQISDLVTSGLDRVGVRIPNHPLTLALLADLDFPLAAPSANPFGYISPTTAQHVATQLGGKIPYILDGGNCTIGIESTIIGFDEGQPVVYRLGGIAVEDIEKVIGKVVVRTHSTSNPKAPGMLKSHYSPRKPLSLKVPLMLSENHNCGYLGFQTPHLQIATKNQRILSNTANYDEAAKNLFAYLRQLDELEIDNIYAELLPEEGLGRAINDRLRRAAANK
jgi:L-threonylcarbamoyladenylate synthase